jgi:hypothetical protein
MMKALPYSRPHSRAIIRVNSIESRTGVIFHIGGSHLEQIPDPLGGEWKTGTAVGPHLITINESGNILRKLAK